MTRPKKWSPVAGHDEQRYEAAPDTQDKAIDTPAEIFPPRTGLSGQQEGATCQFVYQLPSGELLPSRSPQPPWRLQIEEALRGIGQHIALPQAHGLLVLRISVNGTPTIDEAEQKLVLATLRSLALEVVQTATDGYREYPLYSGRIMLTAWHIPITLEQPERTTESDELEYAAQQKEIARLMAIAARAIGRDAHVGHGRLAAEALVQMGRPAVTALLQTMHHEDWRLRAVAAHALGRISIELGTLAREFGLRNDPAMVVLAFTDALRDEYPLVRFAAAHGLQMFCLDGPLAHYAIEPLTAALADEDAGAREAATEALKQLKGEEFLAKVLKKIENKTVKVDEVKPQEEPLTPPTEQRPGQEQQEPSLANRLEEIARAYQEAVAEVEETSRAKREELTTRLQPHLDAYAKHLNTYIKSQSQATIGEKRTLQQWINGELRSRRGVALKCPNTGAPSLLQIDPGDYPEIGRFQFYHMEKGQQIKTASRTTLPDLEVIIADLSLASRGEHEGAPHAAAEDRRRAAKGTRQKT